MLLSLHTKGHMLFLSYYLSRKSRLVPRYYYSLNNNSNLRIAINPDYAAPTLLLTLQSTSCPIFSYQHLKL